MKHIYMHIHTHIYACMHAFILQAIKLKALNILSKGSITELCYSPDRKLVLEYLYYHSFREPPLV